MPRRSACASWRLAHQECLLAVHSESSTKYTETEATWVSMVNKAQCGHCWLKSRPLDEHPKAPLTRTVAHWYKIPRPCCCREVVPLRVEVEVAVPDLTPAEW